MKYKLGDKVIIKTDLISGRRYNGILFTSEMEKYKGQIGIITQIFYSNSLGEYYKLDKKDNYYYWSFSDSMIKPFRTNRHFIYLANI